MGPIRDEFGSLGELLFMIVGPGELWVTDGTPEGTLPVHQDIGFLAPWFTALGDRIYFVGPEAALWSGTPEGTGPVGVGLTVFSMARLGDELFLEANDGLHGTELWKTDGTPAGTVLVADLVPGSTPSFPRDLSPAGDRLYFNTALGGAEGLWSTDGTPEGTVLLAARIVLASAPPFYPGPAIAPLGDRVLFAASDLAGRLGTELWVSDGTPEGTSLLRDIKPGPESSRPAWLRAAGDRVLFAADDGASGMELWESDGTPEGTRLTADLLPGPGSAAPAGLVPAGDLVLFAADDGVAGRELWAVMPGAEEGPCVPRPDSLCLHDGRIRVRAHWINQRNQGQEGDATAVPRAGRTGTFWFFAPDNSELLVKVLDGSSINGHFWTFYGALSDLEYELEVTDLATGVRRLLHHPPGFVCGGADLAGLPSIGPVPDWAASGEAALPARLGGTGGAEPPPGATRAGSCSGNTATLCLQGDRFAVEVAWRNPVTGAMGTGRAVPESDRTGFFWFFAPDNLELAVKVLDGSAVNGRFWVLYGALTNLEYTLRVTDTVGGLQSSYFHPAGDLCGGADADAFPGALP